MDNFQDILDLPHHVSSLRPHMSPHDRAGQFSPFDALVGYEDTIREEARLTENEIRDEQMQLRLEEKMQYLYAHGDQHPLVSVRYFVPDQSKSGGKYEHITDRIRIIDLANRCIRFLGGECISMDLILEVAEKEQQTH